MHLTDLTIRKLIAPDVGQKTYFDDSIGGFGVRVSQGGTKTFIVLLGKQRTRKSIGRYPEISLTDARREAKRLQGNLLNVKSIEAGLTKISFSQARERFLIDTKARTKLSTYTEYERLLNKHFPMEKDLLDVTKRDVKFLLGKIDNAPSTRQHAFVAIRTMMNWCVRQEYIDVPPLPSIKFKTTQRSRILTNDELQIVWNRAVEVGYPFGTIVQLLILTGQRRGEIAALRVNWIEGDQIIFPETITKNSREHRIPYSPMVAELIEQLPNQSDLIFPARGSIDSIISGWSKLKPAFDKDIKVFDYTLHDLRRTYSSNMAKLGVPIHITERLLNHSSGAISGVAAIYNRYDYADEMMQAVKSYENEIKAIVNH